MECLWLKQASLIFPTPCSKKIHARNMAKQERLLWDISVIGFMSWYIPCVAIICVPLALEKQTPKRGNAMKKPVYEGTRSEDNIEELGDDFFQTARRIGRPVSKHPKQRVSIRISAKAAKTFRDMGKGWQTRLSDFLDKAIEQNLV